MATLRAARLAVHLMLTVRLGNNWGIPMTGRELLAMLTAMTPDQLACDVVYHNEFYLDRIGTPRISLAGLLDGHMIEVDPAEAAAGLRSVIYLDKHVY